MPINLDIRKHKLHIRMELLAHALFAAVEPARAVDAAGRLDESVMRKTKARMNAAGHRPWR